MTAMTKTAMTKEEVKSSSQMRVRQEVAPVASAPTKPRICMPSSRMFNRNAFRGGLYEAQDILVEADAVDLICLEPGKSFTFKESWLKRLLYHDVSGRLAFLNPGLNKVDLRQEYDLFVASCQFFWDILYINAIDQWREHCKTSVCWIDEIWAAAIPHFKYWLHALKRFDHVIVGHSGAVAPLSNAIGREVHWVPGAVDTLRFSPYPNPPDRVIDVYSVGRRIDAIHRELSTAAGNKKIFYLHDTFQGTADAQMYSHRQHRDMFANVAKRAKCFMVAPGKIGDREVRGQVEIGYRYYEGAAAGTVMIGQAPEIEVFHEMFPWQDAVVHIQPDGSDVLTVLAELASDFERTTAIGRTNAAEALLRHDWIYRWKEVFRIGGLPPSAGMLKREAQLAHLAKIAKGES